MQIYRYSTAYFESRKILFFYNCRFCLVCSAWASCSCYLVDRCSALTPLPPPSTLYLDKFLICSDTASKVITMDLSNSIMYALCTLLSTKNQTNPDQCSSQSAFGVSRTVPWRIPVTILPRKRFFLRLPLQRRSAIESLATTLI